MAGAVDAGAVVRASLPWADASIAFDRGYSGRLGAGLQLRAQLRKTGATLEGYYRYPKSEADLTLSGPIDPHGHFSLQEANERGVVTGHWEGTFSSPGAASGTWTSVDGKRQLPFTLTGAATLASLGDGTAALEADDEQRDAGFGCTNAVSRPKVSGLVPPERNAKVNAALARIVATYAGDPVSCDAPQDPPWSSEVSIVVGAQVPGYLALTVGTSNYAGGAHPLYGGSCILVDTRTGAEVSLGGVVGGAALSEIARQTSGLLRAFLKDNALDEGPAESVSVDGHICYVDDKTIEVRFGLYEVAPYAYGAPSFPIDVSPLIAKMPPTGARRALFGR